MCNIDLFILCFNCYVPEHLMRPNTLLWVRCWCFVTLIQLLTTWWGPVLETEKLKSVQRKLETKNNHLINNKTFPTKVVCSCNRLNMVMTLYPGVFQFLAENPPHLFTIVINWDSSFNFFPPKRRFYESKHRCNCSVGSNCLSQMF